MSKNKTLEIGKAVEIKDHTIKSWKKFPNCLITQSISSFVIDLSTDTSKNLKEGNPQFQSVCRKNRNINYKIINNNNIILKYICHYVI